MNADGWQIFTDGRAGGFVSHAYGDGYPQPTVRLRPTMGNLVALVHTPQEGAGFRSISEQGAIDPSLTGGDPDLPTRARSTSRASAAGSSATSFGFGMLRPAHRVDHAVGLPAVLVVHRERRSAARASRTSRTCGKGGPSWKAPGEASSPAECAGCSRAGATDIDVLYAHRWGVGWPGTSTTRGPAGNARLRRPRLRLLGAAIMYATPVLGGLQLERRRLRPGSAPGLRQLDAHQVSRAPRRS